LQHAHRRHGAAQIGDRFGAYGVGVAEQQQIGAHIHRQAAERAVRRGHAQFARPAQKTAGARDIPIGEIEHLMPAPHQAPAELGRDGMQERALCPRREIADMEDSHGCV
jgi:hypothetical protein